MTQIYFYKLTTDNGGAPCVEGELLSLAICKPIIRTKAGVGDLIFGFAANSLHEDNRLIYAARITGKVLDGEYYKSAPYAQRSDCIYAFSGGRFKWQREALYHGPSDLVHDLGEHPDYSQAQVLLSEDFRYFGKDGSEEYKSRFSSVKQAIEQLGRGHRVQHDPRLRDEFLAMKDWVWRPTRKRKAGRPTSAPSRRACHRSRGCGVI